MKDPARWRDANSGAGAELRALLQSDRAEAPSDAEKDRIWSSMAPDLAGMPVPPSPPPGPVAAAGTSALAAKVTVVVLAAATGTSVGWYGLRARDGHGGHSPHTAAATVTAAPLPAAGAPPGPRSVPTALPVERSTRPGPASRRVAVRWPAGAAAVEPGARSFARRPPPTTAAEPPAGPGRRDPGRSDVSHEVPSARSVATAPQPPTRRSPGADEEPVAEPPLPSSWGPSPWPAPSPALSGAARSASHAPARSATSELLEESRRLASARAALRAHDPDRALELLATPARDPATLAQEREALTIEALAAKPATRATATTRARAFLRAYPQSPYRARIKAIIFESR